MPWLTSWPSNTAGGVALADSGGEAEAAERFMRRIVGDDMWEALPERTKDQRRAEGPALVAELRSLRPPHEPPYDVASFRCPWWPATARVAPHHQERRGARRGAAGELVVIEAVARRPPQPSREFAARRRAGAGVPELTGRRTAPRRPVAIWHSQVPRRP